MKQETDIWLRSLSLTELRTLKLQKLRAVRASYFQITDGIKINKFMENEQVARGKKNNGQKKWTDLEWDLFLEWYQLYLDLPQEYIKNDYAKLDAIGFDEIYYGNSSIFPECPLVDTNLQV